MIEKTGMKTIIAVTAAFLLFVASGHFMHHTFSALLTSAVLAYLLNPLLKYLEQRGFDRITALILLYGIGIFACFVASLAFIPYLGHQVEALTNSFPLYARNIQQTLQTWKAEIEPHYAAPERAWLLAAAEGWLEQVVHFFSGKSYEQFKGLLFGFFNLLLAPILVFFLLLYKDHVKDILKRLMPLKERRRLIQLGRNINTTLQRFIYAMLLDCVLVGLLTVLALSLLAIEFPVLNGMFAGFASIIPFLGVAVAVIPAALIGYAHSGDLMIIPKVFLAYFLINIIIEGNIIKPLLMRRTLRLNPLWVIFSVMALGEMMGFWGIIMAVPVAALAKIIIREARQIIADGDQDGTTAL